MITYIGTFYSNVEVRLESKVVGMPYLFVVKSCNDLRSGFETILLVKRV